MMYDELIKNLRHDSASALQNCDFDFVHDWMLEAADAIEELQKQRDEWESHAALAESFAQGWIPVTERLPEDGVFVLVSNDDGIIMVAKYETDLLGWYKRYCPYDHDFWWENEDGRISHWMPLPEPP